MPMAMKYKMRPNKSDDFLCKDNQKPYLHLMVDKARTEKNVKEGTYTTYQVTLESNYLAFTLPKSMLRRRYSEFVWLRKNLKEHHSHLQIPALPGKTFCQSKLNVNVVKSRVKELHVFLKVLLGEMEFLSDNSVHLFLQSPLNVSEMEHCLKRSSYKSVPDIIKVCDQLYSTSNLDREITAETHSIDHILSNLENSTSPRSIESVSPDIHQEPSSPSIFHKVSFTVGSGSPEDDPAPIIKAHRKKLVKFSLDIEDNENGNEGVIVVEDPTKSRDCKLGDNKAEEDYLTICAIDGGESRSVLNSRETEVEVHKAVPFCKLTENNAHNDAQGLSKHSCQETIAQPLTIKECNSSNPKQKDKGHSKNISDHDKQCVTNKTHNQKTHSLAKEEDNRILKESIDPIAIENGKNNENNNQSKGQTMNTSIMSLDAKKETDKNKDNGESSLVETERQEEYLFSDQPTCRSMIKVTLPSEGTKESITVH